MRGAGLSWPSLSKALGRKVDDPSRWAVLYLGSAKVADLVFIPIQPIINDIETLPAFRDLLRIAGDKPAVVIVNNAPWRRGWTTRGTYVHPYAVPRYTVDRRAAEQHRAIERSAAEREAARKGQVKKEEHKRENDRR